MRYKSENKIARIEIVAGKSRALHSAPSLRLASHRQNKYCYFPPDLEIYEDWNLGIEKARGQWLLFLGMGDLLLPGLSVDIFLQSLEQASPVSRVIYTPVALFDEAGGYVELMGLPWSRISNRFLHKEMCIPYQGILFHRGVFETFGKYNLNYGYATAYELLLREVKNHPPCFVDTPIVGEFLGRTWTVPDPLAALRDMRSARLQHGLAGTTISWSGAYALAAISSGVARLKGRL
jgi:hypothetical protein